MNRGDTDAALDLFSDEKLGYGVLGSYATDKESLRRLLDWWVIGGNPDNTYRDCQSSGGRTTCIWDSYDGVCTQALGFDVIHYEITFAFHDDRISGMFGDVVGEEKPAVDAALAEMFGWAAESGLEEYLELLRAETASQRSGRKEGELLLEICQAYVQAMTE
jgi:hypothetical protein